MFYAPPKVIKTSVFFTLPEQLREAGVDNEWVAGQPIGTPVGSLLEGPAFDREGNLYCVDVPNGRIYKVSPNAELEVVVEYDGWPNGLKVHRDGRIFIADYKNGIMVFDPETGDIQPYLVRVKLERLKAVNDLFFSKTGDLYFTDQGLTGLHDPTGRLFRVQTDGKVECLISNMPSPNGLVMNLDESALYVAVTRANAVWKIPLLRDGSIAKVGTFVQLSGGGGPDGLALDEAGRLFIAHIGIGCIWVVSDKGEPIYRINACEGTHMTNMAFGGRDGKTLYITESELGQILTATLDHPGKAII